MNDRHCSSLVSVRNWNISPHVDTFPRPSALDSESAVFGDETPAHFPLSISSILNCSIQNVFSDCSQRFPLQQAPSCSRYDEREGNFRLEE